MGTQQSKESTTYSKYACQNSRCSRSDLTNISLEHSSDTFQCRDDLSYDSQQSNQPNGDETSPYADLKLLRPSVEQIVTACSVRGVALKYPHDYILAEFTEKIDCKNPLIALEVIVAMSKLIHDRNLSHTTWDYILNICDFVVTNFDMSAPLTDRDNQIPGDPFPKQFHDLLTEIERLSEANVLSANAKCELFKTIEKCSAHRSEESVSKLIDHISFSIVPTNAEWIDKLCRLLDRFFLNEKRSSVRKKSLAVFSNILNANRHISDNRKIGSIFEETLVDNVALHYLKDIDQDSDREIRCWAVKILTDITLYCTNRRRCAAVLDLMKKIVERPLQKKTSSTDSEEECATDEDIRDVELAVDGLIDIFAKKLFLSPSSSAAFSYKLLVNHLSAHYEDNFNCDFSSKIRHKILDLLLSLRANAFQQIGMVYRTTDELPIVKYSTTVKCSQNDCDSSVNESNSGSHHTSGDASPLNTSLSDSSVPLTSISFNRLFNCIILALKSEKDWNVMKLILENLPQLLENKAALEQLNPSDTHHFVHALCDTCISLINDRSKNLSTYFRNIPSSVTKTDFHGLVYPNLVSLIAYNDQLEMRFKRSLVMCLEHGFTTQPHICIPALMLCVAEMQDIMAKLIPDVVLSLSKISATVHLAIPKLEFLSLLTLWPKLFSSFTGDQFMSVFAIVLPYTNPFKFTDYAVTMAHKVIAMWFLQCRLPLRRQLVGFIIKGLQANVIQPLEDDRKRSCSLNASDKRFESSRLPGTPRIPVSPIPLSVDVSSSPSSNQQSSSVFSFNSVDNQQHQTSNLAKQLQIQNHDTFHTDLIDSCMDFLSKYTFGTCSSVPPKYPITDFIFDRKQSCSWLLGQKIITVTTSGCNSRALYDGLCEECNKLCKSIDHVVGGSTNDEVAHYMASGTNTTHPQLFRSESESHANFSSMTTEKTSPIGRKRHQSEYQQSTQMNHKPTSRAFDDLNLRTTSSSSTSNLLRDTYCNCWCQGWAEILIRSPSGNTSWLQRITNRLNLPSFSTDTSMSDLTCIYNQKETYKEKKPMDYVRDIRRGCNFDGRSFSTPPSTAFKRSSSSPEMEKNDSFETVFDKDRENWLQESPESGKRSDLDSPFEVASATTGDPPAIVSFARNSSGCMSPAKPVASVVKVVDRKNSFSKNILKLDLTPNTNNSVDQLSGSQSLSPLKPSSPNINCKTPQKTPSKLDNIPEQTFSGHRERVHTISVMSPAQKGTRRHQLLTKTNPTTARSSGLSPQFVFLQFFYNTNADTKEKPILLPNNEMIQNTFGVLDFILPYEMHKIGVVYISPGQVEDCIGILSNVSGSTRYNEFLKGLGNLIRLSTVKAREMYLGGLATDGNDGEFACYWEDRLTQVIFHVATLMPNKKSDLQYNAKKAHVGNDYVVIVYNDSKENFNLSTVKGRGHFTYVCVVITPCDHCPLQSNNEKKDGKRVQYNVVSVQTIPEMTDVIGHKYPIMLSDTALPHFVRHLAIQANLASIVYRWRIDNPKSPYISSYVERLRKIKGLKQKVDFINNNDFNHCSNNSPFKSTFNDYATHECEKIGTNQNHYTFPDDFTNYV